MQNKIMKREYQAPLSHKKASPPVKKLTPKERYSKIGWVFVAFLCTYATGNIIFILFSDPSFINTSFFIWFISIVPLYCLAFPVFCFLMSKIPPSGLKRPPKKNISIIYAFQIFFILIAIIKIISKVLIIHIPFQRENLMFVSLNPSELTNTLFMRTVIGSLFIAPIMEEFIFRYILYIKISADGQKTFIFSSALFFSLLHINSHTYIYAFVTALFLAWIMYQTGKIKFPIFFHFLYNFYMLITSTIIDKFPSENVKIFADITVKIGILLGTFFFVLFICAKIDRMAQNRVYKRKKEPVSLQIVFLNSGYLIFILLGIFFIFLFNFSDIIF